MSFIDDKDDNLTVRVDKSRTIWKIKQPSSICQCCKQRIPQKLVIIYFKQPIPMMTIYESELIWNLHFGTEMAPSLKQTMAQLEWSIYKRCEHGRKFIENIQSMEKS